MTLKNVRYAAGAGAGMRVVRGLRVGAVAMAHYETLVEAGSLFGVAREGDLPRRSARVGFVSTGDVVTAGLSVGVQWDVTEFLTLAATVRSPELTVMSGGTTTLQRAFTDLTVSQADATSEVVERELDTGRLQNAGRYLLAAALRFAWGNLRLAGDIQPAFRDRSAEIRRYAVINGRIAVLARATDTLSIGLGLLSRNASRL